MTTFAFRLERVLRWRQAKLELEQFALSRLAAECARWDEALTKIESARAEADAIVLVSGGVKGADLEALAGYQECLAQQKQAALNHREECHQRMEQQRVRLLEARRQQRLLERLRKVRRAEWELAVNREFEALATETYLARWEPTRSRPNRQPPRL
jgi:flagellar export protein FliJ